MKIGSLFSGYGGLDLGVQAVLGGEVAWHVEFDPAPSKILEHRFPGVPNCGDITKVDWAAVEPVDVLTGGFPCQDVSLAGLRRGLKAGTRSGLWSEFAQAIGHLRPRLVVIENVRGLLSAVASGPLESDKGGLGDGSVGPSLRALGAVLGDLADLGYDARWCGVRAADAGAPHGRFRVFILAHPAGVRWREGWSESARRVGGSAIERSRAFADTALRGGRVLPVRPGSEETRRSGERKSDRDNRVSPASHAAGGGRDRWAQDKIGETVPRTALTGGGGIADTPPNASGIGSERRPGRAPGAPATPVSVPWGPYLPTVERWEGVLGRTAPSPTEPSGRVGAQRLSPRFVEWMMGLREGWVTAPEIGLTRAQQLKALGNGVVPQQAELAVRTLLNSQKDFA